MTTFKHEGFTVGQTIAAFDHEPRPGVGVRYAEGRITAVHRDGSDNFPFAHYVVAVQRDTTFPKNPRIEIIVPMEVSFTEWDGRVQLRGSTIEGDVRPFVVVTRDGGRHFVSASSERAAVELLTDWLLDAGADDQVPVEVLPDRRGIPPKLTPTDVQIRQAGEFDARTGGAGEFLEDFRTASRHERRIYWAAVERTAAAWNRFTARRRAQKKLRELDDEFTVQDDDEPRGTTPGVAGFRGNC